MNEYYKKLKDHYQTLYKSSQYKIIEHHYKWDDQLHHPNDNRYGITLIIRSPESIKKNLIEFLNKLKIDNPHQYYYRESDMHITVMSIITCYDGFSLGQIEIPKYIEVIQKSLANISSFELEFKGITASDSCLMIPGYYDNSILNQIRENLRNNFPGSGLQQSLDSRYAITTAHSTVVRFEREIENIPAMLQILKQFEDYSFGKFTVSELEFVGNDWYQRIENNQLLHTFQLNKG